MIRVSRTAHMRNILLVGLDDVQFLSNKLELVSNDRSSNIRFQPTFPYTDETCDRCASCKRNHMLTMTGDDDLIVYIGEGYSDQCPAQYADVVFAKDELLKFCRHNNISSFEYRTFADIEHRFKTLLNSSFDSLRIALRQRRQALLRRREVFLGE